MLNRILLEFLKMRGIQITRSEQENKGGNADHFNVEKHLHVPNGEIKDALSAKDIPDWDFLNYLLFIAELEKAFGVLFTGDEVLRAATLGGIKELLIAKRATL